MRTVVVSHYFPPEIGAPQARLSELARSWSEAGDDVTVLTGMPNHPTGIVPAEYRGAWRRQEEVDGYRVIRTWLYATPNEGFVKKTLGHVSFMVSSVVLAGTRVGRPDVVVVSSPTFFSIGSAWVLSRWKRARFVVEIRDLWPAIFVELGVLTNRRVIRALELIELASYRAADAVVVVSEGFRDNLIERGVPAAKITTIRNGVDLERFAPSDPATGERDEVRRALGAGDADTLVLYIGAHGISHGLTAIADAAAELRGSPIRFAFVGEGAAKAELLARVDELGLDNVTSLPGVPRDDVAKMLAAADICLVPLRDVGLFSTFIPSKLFEYLGAGKAVIGSVRGESATILRDAGAVVVAPEDAVAIARAVRELADDPDRRRAMGERGRAYVEANFDRRELARRYRTVLRRVVDRADRPPAGPAPNRVVKPVSATGAVATTAGLLSFVWNHPENVRHGTTGRLRGVGRVLGWQVWQRGTSRPLSVRMPGGLTLRCHPHSSAASGVLYCGLPEWADMRFVLDYLEDGDVFVDGGANVGVFTLLAASRPAVEVWSYEPSAGAFERLQENLGRNRLERRVHARPVALGAAPATLRLTTGLDTTNHVIMADAAGADVSSSEVEAVTLDADLPSLDRVAVAKIDVEGYEPEVLRGATKLLESRRPALIVEANHRAVLADLLEPFGYRAFDYLPDAGRLVEVGWHHDRGNNVLAIADEADATRRLGRVR